MLAQASKEVIVESIKKILLKKIEKKGSKKKNNEYEEEIQRFKNFFESFDQEVSS